MLQPERYKTYRATVRYHKPPDRHPAPENGQEVIVETGWLSDSDETFPGEFAMYVKQPAGFPYWLPQRDLILLEEVVLEFDNSL